MHAGGTPGQILRCVVTIDATPSSLGMFADDGTNFALALSFLPSEILLCRAFYSISKPSVVFATGVLTIAIVFWCVALCSSALVVRDRRLIDSKSVESLTKIRTRPIKVLSEGRDHGKMGMSCKISPSVIGT